MKATTAPRPEPGAPSHGDRWPSRDAFDAPAVASLTYRLMIRWGWLLIRTHYHVEVRGEAFPPDHPTVIIQNHCNGLGDAHFPMSATRRPLRVLVKYKLLKMPLVGWVLRRIDAIPMYRKKDGVDTRKNASSFEAIDRALLEGSVIAIFPEGESLDSHCLRPLKSGMARMLISAYEASGRELDLRVVPIGLTYEDRDRFRSLASAVIGAPIEIPPLIEAAEGDFRGAIRRIMRESRERLAELTIQADSEEEWRAAIGLERILPTTDAPIGMRQIAALERLRTDEGEGAARRREVVAELGGALRRARLTGDDVLAPPAGFLGAWLPLLAVIPLLVLAGAVWGLPVWTSHLASFRAQTPDKVVTFRILGNFVLVPALAAAVATALGFLLHPLAAVGWVVAAAVSVVTFTWSFDVALGAITRLRQRAIARSSEGTESIAGAIRSIREAFSVTG